MGKPRMTRRDSAKSKQNKIAGMRPIVARYWEFKNQVKYYRVVFPAHGARVTFCVPMPKSWSKRKKDIMRGQPHQQVPDLDNMLKAVLDSCLKNDEFVWHIAEMKKIWGNHGYIEIY
jgi:Holliday junction resolvase RusA-like endonuclease